MHVRHCKLREKQQDRLAEFFVAGVTARAAADLLGIHRHSAALFYHRLRQIIAAALGDPPAMEGEIEVSTRVIWVVTARASVGVVLLARCLSSGCSSVAVMSIP